MKSSATLERDAKVCDIINRKHESQTQGAGCKRSAVRRVAGFNERGCRVALWESFFFPIEASVALILITLFKICFL